jgi:hypothetical protein
VLARGYQKGALDVATLKERFESIWWHDSSLIGMDILKTDLGNDVKAELMLLQKGNKSVPVTVVFVDVQLVKMEVWLSWWQEVKHIFHGECEGQSSEWIDELKNKHNYFDFGGYTHFVIVLCPPGGEIHVLARDFRIDPPEVARELDGYISD